ncbi:MAG: IclR family transcriptional regulator [Solibacillus sp.]|uniref:IclR family transcriptional regulator n=1 Tax=unclassified Solibacillus TaxID=2637870 RepID=UPI003100C3C1
MIASVSKMAQIIDLFFESESALSNKRIAEMLDLPVSSVHHFLKTMCEENILMQDKNRKYRLGWRILEWSNKVMYQQEMNEKVAPIAANLVNRFKGSVHVGMFDNGQVRFIFKSVSPHTGVLPTYIGVTRFPAHATSIGKVLLAYNPSFVKAVEQHGMQKFTKNTISDIGVLKKELQVIHKQGFAVSNGENETGTFGIAAPIKSYSGQVIAAFNFVCAVDYIQEHNFQLILNEVIRSAQIISREIGYITF